jgi:hypothetical protein
MHLSITKATPLHVPAAPLLHQGHAASGHLQPGALTPHHAATDDNADDNVAFQRLTWAHV